MTGDRCGMCHRSKNVQRTRVIQDDEEGVDLCFQCSKSVDTVIGYLGFAGFTVSQSIRPRRRRKAPDAPEMGSKEGE